MNGLGNRLQILGIAAGLVLVTLTAAALAVIRPWSNRASYAAAPFEKVADDFPRILPIAGKPPAKDKNALDRYYAERKKIRTYIREQGAIQRATPEEREAVLFIYDGKYVRAWEAAVTVLRRDPESAPAWYALAEAEQHGEKNLAKALYAVRKARRILEKKGQADPRDFDSHEWYLYVLDLEHDILRSLERFEEALQVVDLIEQTYQPMPWMKVWPLFKLNRLAEAEQAISAMEETRQWPSTSLNNRLVLEQQYRRRSTPYQFGRRLAELEGDSSPVLWSNVGEVAQGDLRLSEAEAAYRKSAEMGRPDFRGTAYTYLTNLYVQQGRFREAVDARRKAQAQRAVRAPHTLQDDQGRVDRSMALLHLAIGQSADAERFARRMHTMPDRLGSITTRADDQNLSNDLLLAAVLAAREEEERELSRNVPSQWSWLTHQLMQAGELWNLQHRIRKIVADFSRLNDLRPNVPDGAPIETWMIGDLLRQLPPSVALAMARKARAEEIKAAQEEGSDFMTRAAPYFDAIEAEASLLAGQPEAALELARNAVEHLPDPGERLLRARTAAVAGEAARQLNDASSSRKYFNVALANAPIVFRLTRIAIPARFDNDGSPLAVSVLDRLRRSPRFRNDPAGFPISIATEGERIRIRMHRDDTIHCDEVLAAADSGDDPVTAAVAAIHQRVLSPTARLTAIEVNSLDDSPAAIKVRQDSDKLMDAVRPK